MTRPASPAGVAELDVAAIRARAETATPGPWRSAGGYVTVRDPDGGSFRMSIYHIDELGAEHGRSFQAVPYARAEDAKFVSAARTDVPALCDELTATRERLAEAERDLRLMASGRQGARDARDEALAEADSLRAQLAAAQAERGSAAYAREEATRIAEALQAELFAAQGRERAMREALTALDVAAWDYLSDGGRNTTVGGTGYRGALIEASKRANAALASADAPAARVVLDPIAEAVRAGGKPLAPAASPGAVTQRTQHVEWSGREYEMVDDEPGKGGAK